jgi:hypothetical protein
MPFITWELPEILDRLNKLSPDATPRWGKFTAQQMVEHLIDGLSMAMGKMVLPLEVSIERAEKSKLFLYSDAPFVHDIKVNFVDIKKPVHFEDLDLAIDELSMAFLAFTEYYEVNPNEKHLHPYFGLLSHQEWILLHKKHFTHHFEQFGI